MSLSSVGREGIRLILGVFVDFRALEVVGTELELSLEWFERAIDAWRGFSGDLLLFKLKLRM